MAATTAMVTAMFGALVVATALTGDLGNVASMPAAAIGWFVAASLVHFLVGWTLFAVSQQRIGPSRTAAVLSTNPVMAALIAAVAISQELRPITWIGVFAVTAGVAIVALTRAKETPRSVSGMTAILAATLMFSISPIFVTFGLDHSDTPLIGLAIGIAVTVPCMHLATRVLTGNWVRVQRSMAGWLVLGGVSAGFAITAQWTAFDLIPVGTVVSLQQLSTPVVLFVGPVLLSAPGERSDARMLVGTSLIIGGAVLVALFGRALT
jgi:drug/metabolite transporter (DMT)-like permease